MANFPEGVSHRMTGVLYLIKNAVENSRTPSMPIGGTPPAEELLVPVDRIGTLDLRPITTQVGDGREQNTRV